MSAAETKVVVTEAFREAYDTYHYAPAVKSKGHVYLSGVLVFPTGEGRPEERYAAGVRAAFEHIREILTAAGSSFDQVIKLNTYHTDLNEGVQSFSQVKDEFITEPYPAWTAVGVAELGLGGLAEIEVTATYD